MMNRERMGKNVMELVGTATFLCTIQISVSLGASMAPVAIGVALITLVYAGGPISGAHYNPAISLAIYLRGKMSIPEMIEYWIAQIVGGILGALLGGFVSGSFAAIGVGADANGLQAFLAEVVFTFFLCFVVLSTATSAKADGNSYFGAAIGLVVMAGAIAVGPISGGAFNPAVALGLNVSKGLSNMLYCLTTVAANLLGGCLAAGLFYVVAPDEFEANGATAGETTSLL